MADRRISRRALLAAGVGVAGGAIFGCRGGDAPSAVQRGVPTDRIDRQIYFAELCYQRDPTPQVLDRWREIVLQTAQFMASYAALVGDRYVLGPPLKTVSENTDPLTTANPLFEVEYWRFGLRIAQAPWNGARSGLGGYPESAFSAAAAGRSLSDERRHERYVHKVELGTSRIAGRL